MRSLVAGYVVLTASLLSIGLLLTHPLRGSVGRWDLEVNRWFVSHRTGVANSVTGVATTMLETLPVILVALVAVVVLVRVHRAPDAAVIAVGLLLEITIFLSVTFVVARPRPDVPRLNATPMTSSFPSGHAAAAVVLYAGLALAVRNCTRERAVRIAFWLLAAVMVLGVSWSRVYRGMHHPTDVLVGVVFGAAALAVAVHAVGRFAAASRHVAGAHEPDEQERERTDRDRVVA